MHVRAGLVRLATFQGHRFQGHRSRTHRFLRRALAVAAGTALASAGLAAVPAAQHAAAATSTDAVTVNATSGLGTIPSGAIGLNTAVYDSDMNDAPIPGLLKAAGIDALRYPGGSYSDIYNWQTSTAADNGYVAPGTTFSDFMSTASSAGAQPIITFNYGTGTPALAAAWVQDADVTNNYGIQYWEVGNEVYGNGTYGANWETDSHCDTSLNGTPVTVGSEPSQTYNCGPAEYAAGVKQYLSAVHAVDPNAKVCPVLTTPGFWPDGVTNSEYSAELEPDRADRTRLGHPVRDRALLPRRLVHRGDAHRPAGHRRDRQHPAQRDLAVRRDQQPGQRAGPGHRDQLHH